MILEAAEKYGYTPNKAAAVLKRNPIRIGTVLADIIPDFYSELIRGINASQRELQDFKVESEIRLVGVSGDIGKTDRELSGILDELCRRKVNGIILNYPVASRNIRAKLNEIIEKGIHIVTLNYDFPGIRRLFASMNNGVAAGRMGAQMLSFTSKGKNAAIFSANTALAIHQNTIRGFGEEAEKLGLTLVGVYDNNDIPQLAYDNTKRVLEEHPDLNGIYINSANSVPVCRYLEEHGRSGDVSVIASDVFPELTAYINSGTVSATIFQDPFMQSRNAFMNLYSHITENCPIPEILTITPQIVIRSNLNLYL